MGEQKTPTEFINFPMELSFVILKSFAWIKSGAMEDSYEEGDDSEEEGLIEEFQDEPIGEKEGEEEDEEGGILFPAHEGKQVYDDLFDNPEEDFEEEESDENEEDDFD